MTTPAEEDYLRTVYHLQQECDPVSTGKVATALRVRPASATKMIQRLAAEGLVDYTPYHKVCLTASGKQIACRVLRNRYLVERYLTESLALLPAVVAEIADTWEHFLSATMAEHMQAALRLDQSP